MQQISVFDMLKIGVGPSSSHTLGPWRAAERWIAYLKDQQIFEEVTSIYIELFGSLSLTGKGHSTDIATILGLLGQNPETMDVSSISERIKKIYATQSLLLNGEKNIKFTPEKDIIFNDNFLPFHPNGIQFSATTTSGEAFSQTYYSIGGGFIIQEMEEGENDMHSNIFPYPINTAKELETHCEKLDLNISKIVLLNEQSLRKQEEIELGLQKIWRTMLESMYSGAHSDGYLPGKLHVKRRAYNINKTLIKGQTYHCPEEWMEVIRKLQMPFHEVFRWVSCFGLAVNEVNASLGRIVTAPTNGSAGVIPAVLMYYLCFVNKFAGTKEINCFLLTAGEIGSIFKKGATISAAMGGCQAEIGVSSAMAAAALTEALGGSPQQCLIAAEIAMEHHLGLTCDPIDGLVQVPCIERNAMGAIKAINAAEMALDRDPKDILVPLDKVIQTMWETAQDMNTKYKETSKGGLAVAVSMVDC